MTLYRAGGDSPIIRSLIRAAERGVQVAVLVELKARFDEATNVNWAKQLERAGVHVVYGMVGLKTHSKCVLVVRDDGDQLRRYCHIGTGNYNTKTARLYEDLGILTCDPDIGADAAKLFNHLTGYSRNEQYHTLLVAPRDLRPKLLELIEQETRFGPDGHITLKANSIADTEMIEALYEASQAGVRIDLVVRGISCLRAGVEGLSENIRVRSILGRYLEHSRIYRFAHGDVDDQPLYLIGSADLMPRNLDRRVEVLVPIEHPKHREWLDQVFEFLLADDIVRWELQPDDTWARCGPPRRLRAARPGAPLPLGRRAPGAPDATLSRGLHGRLRAPVHRPFTWSRLRRSPALPTVRVRSPRLRLTRLQRSTNGVRQREHLSSAATALAAALAGTLVLAACGDDDDDDGGDTTEQAAPPTPPRRRRHDHGRHRRRRHRHDRRRGTTGGRPAAAPSSSPAARSS